MGNCLIFSTVGTQLPFDRLTRLVESLSDMPQWSGFDFHYQVGLHGYRPVRGIVMETMCREQFDQMLDAASLVITHCGIGTLVSCAKRGVPLITCPRRAKYGEHRNDHQLATAKALRADIAVVSNLKSLAEACDSLVMKRHHGNDGAHSDILNDAAIANVYNNLLGL